VLIVKDGGGWKGNPLQFSFYIIFTAVLGSGMPVVRAEYLPT